MRDYFDPTFYHSTSQGPEYTAATRPVKKSHSVVGSSSTSGSLGGNVLGRFLKLGKSKSDAQGSKNRPTSYIDDLEDFRLSPSVLNRGPVEKMVHKSNSRKDVSRSHSWIYGSVKLPSDLPFGYGYANGFGSSPSGSESNSGSGSPSNGHHTHGLAALQIPRCQMVDYYCSCECGGDFDFLTAGPGDGSVSANNGPCKACAYDWALSGGKNAKNRKQGSRNSTNSADAGNSFVSSVRKLTWKSLKQAVKKRPSLDNMRRPSELRVGVGGFDTPIPFVSSQVANVDRVPNPNGVHGVVECNGNMPNGNNGVNGYCHYSHSQHAFSADDLQPSYFFPEKKNMYSSCTDIFRDPIPHATASVRVRPKPSRQSWQFTNENEPVPNYQEENVYHSEWDLRQCIPYDVWVNTTSHIKPRTTMSTPKPKTPVPEGTSRNSSLSKSTSVPYLAEIKSNSSKGMKVDAVMNGSNLKMKSSSSGAVNNADTISMKSVGSSKSARSGGESNSNGIIKRPSILSADVNAYQLLKAQTRNGKISEKPSRPPADELNDALSSSSDDLSDNALTSDSHMRIAGQKIYMAPNLNGNQSSSSTSSNSNRTNPTATSKINGVSKIQNIRSKIRQENISSDEWSEDGSGEQLQSKHVSMSRDEYLHRPDKANKGLIGIDNEARNLKTGQYKAQQQNHHQPNSNGMGVHANLNNGDYDNYRETNGTRSTSNMIENSNLLGPNQTSFPSPTTQNYNHDGQSQTQRDSNTEENYHVEFEEYIFEDSRTTKSDMNQPYIAKSGGDTSMQSFRQETSTTSSTPTMRNPLANSSNSFTKSEDTNKQFQIQNHNVTNSSEERSLTASSSNLGSNNTNCSNNTKSNGKFGALRRRKSRNGSNNPGKLLREVIYEEEVEHEQLGVAEDSISSHGGRRDANGHGANASQRTNKSNEYAVKIVVSHSAGTTDYVKPILKNRERVYDTPINNNGSSTNEKDNANPANHCGNNDIYFDSSVSTASTSTLKKKVQFDQNRIVVCGGDSGPDSDECGIDDDEPNQEKSDSNYGNEENEDDEGRSIGGSVSGTSNQMNGSYYYQNNKESGSVSLKSNLSRKSALNSNHDNLSRNQSPEIKQKSRSTFEEEVARKAASFALARKNQAEAEAKEAQKRIAETAPAIKRNTGNSIGKEMTKDEECYDGSGSVNNLKQVLNEDQSRFTSTSTNNPAPGTNTNITANSATNMTTSPKRKSNLKSNCKSSDSRSSQGTGSITQNPEPIQLQLPRVSANRDYNNVGIGSTNNNAKERHFTKNSNNKASHGVTSSILKAKRIANSAVVAKSPVNDCSQQLQKIINPNSLLFNDTTRIRLNQSRPSLNETFKLNLSRNGQANRYGSSNHANAGPTARGIRLKQSNSFRTVGSAPLRPKDPPPPPPVAMRNSSISPRLQMSLSSSLSGQIDKLLSKSSSTNQIYGGSLNGNRLLTKSEISLPMGLQTTSNQASSAIKNQNSHGQKDNVGATGNNRGFSGFETNGAKTSAKARTSPNTNVDSKKIDVNSNGRSKSLNDRCEALDRVVGQKHTTKSNGINSDNKSNSHVNAGNNRNNKVEEIVNKVQPHNRGNLKNNANATNNRQTVSKSEQISNPMRPSKYQQPMNSSNSSPNSQNIEIVTKENSVSEIRIYSTTPTNKLPYESNDTVVNNEKNKSTSITDSSSVNGKKEIHYAATDIFPQNDFVNGKKQFRQPAALPPIPHETVVPSRPQSTSVVLIVDSITNNNNNCTKGTATVEPPSPITYSQPVDTLPRNLSLSTTKPIIPSKNFSPLTPTPKGKDLASSTNFNSINNMTNVDNVEESEPLYDDVINHSNSTTDQTTSHGSLGRRFLISSLSSMKPNRNPLTHLQDNCSNRSVPSAQIQTAQVVSSTLPCLACPPSLPPPNLPSKNLSEFHNRPVVLDEDEGERTSFCDVPNEQNIDEEVDNLYNDIADGVSNSSQGNSLQSFASSMKGALLNAIKSMDFDRRSILSNHSNNSGGSNGNSVKYDFKSTDICNIDNFIYDDTLSLRSANSEDDVSRSYYKANGPSRITKSDQCSSKVSKPALPPPPSSIRCGGSVTKPLGNVIEQDESLTDAEDNEPLYDDVINFPQSQSNPSKGLDASHSSDSGAESEDAIPPPLPAQGPPKISTELPLLTFPLLLNKSYRPNDNNDLSQQEKVMDILVDRTPLTMNQTNSKNKSKAKGDSRTLPNGDNEENVLTRTRSLLNELNEKLTQLNSLSSTESVNSCSGSKGLPPLEFSTYNPNKAAVLSSSESSGVEEDYNSEKNYSLSNSSDGASASSSSAEENYKLAQVTKLVTETITMARGKFLDSMKSSSSLSPNSSANLSLMLSSNRTSPVGRDSGSSPCINEEPIYEEIGDINRSNSPIYADAFDAKSIFDGASRNEILSFLESIRDRLTTSDSNSSGSQSSSVSSKKGNESDRNYTIEGTEQSHFSDICHLIPHAEERLAEIDTQNKLVLRKLCPDCNDVPIGNQPENETSTPDNLHTLCNSCNRKRSERKELITEIHETEIKYGRDLKIISEEFYKPIQIAGLLTKEQLDQIFLNVVELMEISAQLTSMLKTEIVSANVDGNDEDLITVNIGKIFLDIGESMMTAFQTYCTRQASAGALLAQLEKEKELLRIFLRVSQMENTVLRRMNLPAFLMVPVQRVTRYPLLLSRLMKVTPVDHFSRDELQSAHEKIEQHLEHMNKATREVASVKLWRRISIINGNSTPLPRRSNNELEGASVSIRKMAIDVLDWTSLTDINCIIDNQLGIFHFNGKPMRGIYACLLARGKNMESLAIKMEQEMFFPPSEELIKEVKLVLVRVKNTRFCLLREPLCLSKCVVSQGENEFQDFVEINEITTKNTYHLQGIDKQATGTWLKYLQCYSMCVGQWRRPRGALANIMMNGMLKHL